MYCLKCFREYPPETEYCEECSFLLTGDEKYGSHFLQLVRCGEEMMNDEITAPLFRDVLANMGKVLDQMEASIEAEYAHPDLKRAPQAVLKVVEQPLAYAREGIATYREALRVMTLAAEGEDKSRIKEGLEMAEKAHDYLNLSRQMSEYAAAELEKLGQEVAQE